MSDNYEIETNNELSHEKRTLKTKDYILRAQRNYYNKHKDEAEYMEKLRQNKMKYRNEHKQEYNEKQRNYMRDYRAKKKLETQKQSGEVTLDEVCNKIQEIKC